MFAPRLAASPRVSSKTLLLWSSLNHELFLDGLDLLSGGPDKGYSLEDCISTLIMRRQGITEIRAEGFLALFRDS